MSARMMKSAWRLAMIGAVTLTASVLLGPALAQGFDQPGYGPMQPSYGPPGDDVYPRRAYGPRRPSYGPFSSLAGTWSGAGTIEMANGAQERIRCRADYQVDPGGVDLRQFLRCASPSTRFDVTSDVVYRNGEVTGSWTEASRNASGTVSGEVVGNELRTHIAGANFAADLALVTRGNRQSVSIRPEGGGDIAGVSIDLHRTPG